MSEVSFIPSKEITFVIQGVAKLETIEQIKVLRDVFPDSSIVFSTSQNNEIAEKLLVDQLVVSDDPGFFYEKKGNVNSKPNNVNRQIVSTLAGLKNVVTKYAFKLRADLLLNGTSFLAFFDQYKKSEPHYQIFEKKILACSFFSVNPRKVNKFAFHPSDFIFFGLTNDLINLFDVPLMNEEEAYWGQELMHRYVPEQYLFIKCLEKNGKKIDCKDFKDISVKMMEETERYFASNFVFLSYEQLSLVPLKQAFFPWIHPKVFVRCYTHIEWLHLYKKYVDPNIVVPVIDEDRKMLATYYKRSKKYRLLANFCALFSINKINRKKIREKILVSFLKP